MKPITRALAVICEVMPVVIIRSAVRSWSTMSQETEEQPAENGIEFVKYLKTARPGAGR